MPAACGIRGGIDEPRLVDFHDELVLVAVVKVVVVVVVASVAVIIHQLLPLRPKIALREGDAVQMLLRLCFQLRHPWRT